MRNWLVVGLLSTALALANGKTCRAGQLEAAPLRLSPRPVPVAPTPDPINVGCRDFRNRPVRTMDVPTLGDVGRAEFVEGFPVIMLDPGLLTTLPVNLQTFFKLHECAHHVLGHLFAPTVDSEKQADCWAIKEGRKHKIFGHDEIVAWKPYFAASLGSKMGHLPGPERVTFLVGCFDEPE